MQIRFPRRQALALGALVAVAALAPTAPAQTSNASVYVIHGIRGEDLSLPAALPVDVQVDGACLLSNFRFGDIAGPLSLPAGTYNIKIRLATDAPNCDGPIVFNADVPFASGENATVIAHLDAAGAPTASKFVNDLQPSALGTRAVFHHTAAAPQVDIRVRGLGRGPGASLKLDNVANGQAGGGDLLPGTYALGAFLAGTKVSVLGPARGTLEEGSAYLIYVVGSAANNTLTVITLDPLLM